MTLLKSIASTAVVLFLYSFSAFQGGWYKIEDKDCEILFPKLPKSDTVFRETSLGKMAFYRYILQNEKPEDSTLAYELIKTEYPASEKELINPSKTTAESLFNGAISASIKKVDGKVVAEKDLNVGDYYGKEVKISFANNAKLIKFRCFLVKTKVYLIETITTADKEINNGTTTFFKSFKIK